MSVSACKLGACALRAQPPFHFIGYVCETIGVDYERIGYAGFGMILDGG